jgi:hypothetical protein
MKYILMMGGRKSGWDTFAKWPTEDLRASAEGLASPDQAKVVRAGKDGMPVTDGVFPESKEFLAGYWIVEVADPEEAYSIAARASAAPGPGRAGRPRIFCDALPWRPGC